MSSAAVSVKRKANREYAPLFTNRHPFLYSSSHIETPRTKADIVGYSDDNETQKKLRPVNTRLNATMIDRIVNGHRLPLAPAQAISKIPTIPASKYDHE